MPTHCKETLLRVDFFYEAKEKGIIRILLKSLADDTVYIRVKDDGIGIPDEIDFEKTNTLGLKLTRTIVRDQLMGTIKVYRDKGTETVIEFKLRT